jgi:hypothetical protein
MNLEKCFNDSKENKPINLRKKRHTTNQKESNFNEIGNY